MGANPMKVLHTADLHLRGYEDERWRTLQKLIQIGEEEGIDLFAISGDLFDGGVNAQDLRPQIREVFSGNRFKVVLIPGNHDCDSYKEAYFGEDVIVLTDLNRCFEYGDVRIWGMPFERIGGTDILDKLRSLAERLSGGKGNVVLYHGELLDSFFSRRDFGDEGDERYMPIRLSYFKDLNVDYVLAGHFHARFDVRRLEGGGYFIYPGSPISITRRETGQRKANLFEVGKPPTEYPLDTPHFEEVLVELDPSRDKDPTEVVRNHLRSVHPQARIILRVAGYIHSEEADISEIQLAKTIREITGARAVEEHLEFRDVRAILEDELFKSFADKLGSTCFEEEKKRHMRNIAIRAMARARL